MKLNMGGCDVMKWLNSNAFKTSVIYLVFGVAWILFSDWFLLWLYHDIDQFVYFSTIKGLVFVMLSTLVIWFALHLQAINHDKTAISLKQHIASREHVENALHKESDRLHQVIKHAPVPMILHSESRQVLNVSDALVQATGYVKKDIPTIRAWCERAFPFKYEEIYNRMIQLYQIKDSMFEGTYQVYTKDGNILYWDMYTAFIGLNQDGMRAYLTSAIDVTERKSKEKELMHHSYHDDLTGLYNRRYYNEISQKIKTMQDVGIVLADLNGLKLINDVFGHAQGDDLLITFANLLKKHLPKNVTIARIGGDEFVAVVYDFTRHDFEAIAQKIKQDIQSYKDDIIPSAAIGYAIKRPKEKLKHAFVRAENMLYQDKIYEYNQQTNNIISALKKTLFNKTDESAQHISRLKTLAEPFVDALNMNSEQQKELMLLIELHDIGKISIDQNIYDQEAPLTSEQRKDMERHTEIGYRIANALPKLKSVAYAILTHHENWDGSGYPFGLSGKEIPLLSRVFRIVESYELMTRRSHYKEKIHSHKAVKELKDYAETIYDASLVDVFVDSLEKAK